MTRAHRPKRFSTMRSNRPFYVWYLTQKRLARMAGATPPPGDAPTMDSEAVTMDDTTLTMDSDE